MTFGTQNAKWLAGVLGGEKGTVPISEYRNGYSPRGYGLGRMSYGAPNFFVWANRISIVPASTRRYCLKRCAWK